MKEKYLHEVLALYNLNESKLTLIRHNENLTYKLGNDYLLQIHQPVEGFNTKYIYEELNRSDLRKTEIDFQKHLQKSGMVIREVIKNNNGEYFSKINDQTLVTVSKWIDGESLEKLSFDDELCFKVGQLVANIHLKSNGFNNHLIIKYDINHCNKLKMRISQLEEKGLLKQFANAMLKSCDLVARVLEDYKNEFVIIHGDLSASNILNTKDGLVAIDFSFLGLAHPMLDLAILFGNIGGISRRLKIIEGYKHSGGKINFKALDACFILSLLDGISIHFVNWKSQDWFNSRMKRWYDETFTPFINNERMFSDDYMLLNLPNY